MTRAIEAAGGGALVLLALGLLGLACGGGAARDAWLDLGIPPPDFAGVEQDVVDAITEARTAVQQAPGSGESWGNLADRFFVQGFVEAAAPCYARAQELDPGSSLWTYRLGWSLIDQHPEEAAAVFERSLRALDDYAPAHEAYATALVQLGRADEALEHFTRASQLDPAAPQAETSIGRIHLARGDFEAARAHLEQALARDGAYTEAHTGLAQVYLALGREEDARRHAEISRTLPQVNPRADWRKAPSLPPAGARARTKFGRQLARQGQLAEAEEQYRIALRSNPSFYQARVNLARLLARQGKVDEGRALLEEWQKLEPSSATVQQDLARLVDSVPEEE